ncbi:hypothetical protein J4E82_005224 [Alternaria postmessia]|nr:uncharacterized protein J4E82_005224 [Alternaria postmessia]KAI5375980.1 hypothetical protein J4E82_005224 [Alternaria postmessia]
MSNLPPISDADIAYSNASSLMVQAGTIFGIALAITLLRCYVRLVMLKSFGKDDWTIIVSMSQNKLTALQLRPPPMCTGGALCLSVSTFSQIALFNSIVNIATDFLLALLPIPVIFSLQVRIRIKIMLALVLSLGTFASVAGIMKAHVSKTILNDPERFVHDTFSMWNFIELDVGILAASLPTLRPLFNRFLEAARSVVQSQPTTTPRFSFREPGSLGYAKQTDEFSEVLELGQYKAGCETAVRVSSRLPEGHDVRSWRLDRAHNSESVMPTIHSRVSHSKDILVTKDISVS